ncbi:MAG: hypothetical protein H6734_20330 [Alphaproteobacteria bacterium]|nr:hypothetical protein [Alphaproteobacteria bacterium]
MIPICPGDALERNDLANPVDLVSREESLYVGGLDSDAFRFEVRGHHRLLARVVADDANAQLVTRLYREGVPLGFKDERPFGFTIDNDDASTRTYTLEVLPAWPPECAMYSIDIRDTCFHDALEPNNAYYSGTPVSPPVKYTDLAVSPWDRDNFTVTLPPDHTVRAAVAASEGEVRLTMQEVSTADAILPERTDHSITYTNTGPSRLVAIEVDKHSICTRYDIEIATSPYPCEHDDILEPNDAMSVASPLTSHASLFVPGTTSDWYTATVASGQAISITVQTPGGPAIAVGLIDSTSTVLAEGAPTSALAAQLDWTNASGQPVDVFLHVWQTAPNVCSVGTYELTVTQAAP